MRKKEFTLELGNFICKFGKDIVLLNFLEELILPSFQDQNQKRAYGKTSYFFHNVNIVHIPNKHNKNVVGVIGRIIKDTILEREQIFEEGKGLIKDTSSMKSSPSAVFLLILNNHRLMYIKETKDAPSKETFGHTFLNFLRSKHKQHIEKLYVEAQKTEDSKVTKKKLLEKIPRPTLEIIPLTSEDDIEEFIKKYELLKTIEIKFAERNDENDNEPFFEQLQNRKSILDSEITSVRHHNKKGLDKKSAIQEIKEATAQGNQKVALKGTDSEGDKLNGDNEKFQIKKSIEELTGNWPKDALNLYNSFVSLVTDGIIKVQQEKKSVTENLSSFLKRGI